MTTGGIWRASFQYRRVKHELSISDVEIVLNGEQVARDAHTRTAARQADAVTWRFVIPEVPAGAEVTLRAKVSGKGGNNSHGVIVLTKSDRLEPTATITAKLSGHGKSTPAMAADWDDATSYWMAGHPQAEDTVVC